jgi:hypothetical protein
VSSPQRSGFITSGQLVKTTDKADFRRFPPPPTASTAILLAIVSSILMFQVQCSFSPLDLAKIEIEIV